MKIKSGYILRSIAGETVVIPEGGLNFDSMITLNGTGAFLWKKLESEATIAELVDALLEEYEVERATADKCVGEFTDKLKESGFLE